MAQTQCAGVVTTGRLWGAVQRWEDDQVRPCDVQRKRSGREDCRLNSIYTPIDMTSTRAVGTPTLQMLTIAALVPARGSNHRQTGERTRDTPGNIDTVAHTALRPSSMTIALRAIVIATGSITAKSSGDV